MTLVWASSYTTKVSDSDAQAYIEAVESEDNQQLEIGVAVAINNFIIGCKSDGIWDAIKACCILAGARTLEGALVPLKGEAPTNNSFVEGDYNRETGLVGDGRTKYLDSNRAGNSDPQNNHHASAYAILAGTVTFKAYLGNDNFGNGSTNLGADSAGNAFFRCQSSGASIRSSSCSGFLGVSRNNGSNFISRTDQLNQTAVIASQAPPLVSTLIFRLVSTNTNTDARLSFYSIGESLDLALLDARVSTLMTDIGAAIP